MPESGTLYDAFLDELRDSYDAEKQLTKALAVQLIHDESVEKSAGATKKILSNQFLRIDASGSLFLRNLKGTTVHICVKVTMVGDLTSSSVKPASNVEGAGSVDLANSSRTLTWEIELKPKEQQTLKYTRCYWMRN